MIRVFSLVWYGGTITHIFSLSPLSSIGESFMDYVRFVQNLHNRLMRCQLQLCENMLCVTFMWNCVIIFHERIVVMMSVLLIYVLMRSMVNWRDNVFLCWKVMEFHMFHVSWYVICFWVVSWLNLGLRSDARLENKRDRIKLWNKIWVFWHCYGS